MRRMTKTTRKLLRLKKKMAVNCLYATRRKEAKTTPDEGKAEDDVDVAALQKDAVAVSFRVMYFNIASKTRNSFL